ncbi:bacillithiol system redox-active protein YtxJ [Algoriphagus sp. AGSA1]|uniref:bacillithiol system redox-active protein YtxJ n=1 Tax=Algoriphagus sp. AGSA1 TaxID=2907213 RepID=UPI001F33045D|nr:bacillithiol system redox-active protein YtxJ [Algoriphagus sp. AGSA1]MCE7057501.1 bacillithiol system redox-active protein YtxJ [Algoriphagus sp. AGSA1]
MNWNKLTEDNQLSEIKSLSKEMPVLIFKHSTRCSISSMALERLSRKWKEEDNEKIAPFYLDLISFRQLSDLVAREFGVPHESPQLLVVKNGVAVYHASHFDISYADLFGKL